MQVEEGLGEACGVGHGGDDGWVGLGHHMKATAGVGGRKSGPEPARMGAEEQTEGSDG